PTPTTADTYTLSLHDALPIYELQDQLGELIHGEEWPTIRIPKFVAKAGARVMNAFASEDDPEFIKPWMIDIADDHYEADISKARDRKSTRLNSSHVKISYAVF